MESDHRDVLRDSGNSDFETASAAESQTVGFILLSAERRDIGHRVFVL
jgi:hypothetical protein